MEKYGLFDDSDVANYDLKRLTRDDEFGRLFHKALGQEQEWQDERGCLTAAAQAERIRIFGPEAAKFHEGDESPD